MGDTDRSITELAQKYLRAVDEHEARKEALLAEWADEFYRPGYLDDDEWERLKALMEADETDYAFMQVKIAAFRKVATEHGREDDFDGDWPAKGSAGGAGGEG